jgi:hypothetical protein
VIVLGSCTSSSSSSLVLLLHALHKESVTENTSYCTAQVLGINRGVGEEDEVDPIGTFFFFWVPFRLAVTGGRRMVVCGVCMCCVCVCWHNKCPG